VDTKELVWLGNSLKDLKSMPLEVRKNAGYQLSCVQSDLAPIDWKPMSSIGLGVREIRIKYKGQYRIIYRHLKITRFMFYILLLRRHKKQVSRILILLKIDSS